MDSLTGNQINRLMKSFFTVAIVIYLVSLLSRSLGYFALSWGNAQTGSRALTGKAAAFIVQELQGLTALPVVGLLFGVAIVLFLYQKKARPIS